MKSQKLVVFLVVVCLAQQVLAFERHRRQDSQAMARHAEVMAVVRLAALQSGNR